MMTGRLLTVLVLCGGLWAWGGGKKDTGEATMQLDGKPWQAERASARVRGDRLSLTFSRTDGDGPITAQSVQLKVPKFKGPGTYEASHSSVYVEVTVANTAKKEALQVLDEALGGSEAVFLNVSKVEITSVSDSEVKGTFEASGADLKHNPHELKGGTFRALRKK